MNNTSYHHTFTILVVLLATLLLASCTGQTTRVVPTLPANTPTSVVTVAVTSTWTPTPEQTAAPETHTPTTVEAHTPTPAVAAAAWVNGQPILLSEYQTQVDQAVSVLGQQQSFDPNTAEGNAALLQLRRQILDALIDQALIEQAAVREGISISGAQAEEEMARLVGENVTQLEDWLQANGLTRETFKVQLQRQLLSAAFQEHMASSLPSAVEQVHARHILVMSEAEAMDLLLKLRSGESFATLAKQYSQDQASSDLGGDLGFFPRNVMPVEIEAVAFALAPGQVSGIVKTDFGYHIIDVVEKDPSREVPEEMLATWRQHNFLQWLEAQRSVAKIEYIILTE